MRRFDWAIAIASYWTVAGLYADAGWHIRHDVDTFFTWSHALLYSGLVLLAALLVMRGSRVAYRLSAIGAVIFLAGGIADFVNHLFFGFEAGFDALLSPTHLIIGVGVLLIITGPIRSATLARPRPMTLPAQIPLIIAAAATLELLHWGTQVFFRADAQRALGTVVPHELTPDAFTLMTLHFFQQGGSLVAVTLQSLLMMGVALYLVRNFVLQPGALAALFVLGNGLIAVTHSITALDVAGVLLASFVCGLVGDAFLRGFTILRSRAAYGAFAFIVPVVYTSVLLLFTVAFMGGTWWDPIFAAGAVFYAGLFALLLSIAAFPTAADRQEV